MVLVKASGTWPWELIAETFTPTLDLNDAGFLPSQNLTRVSGKLSWRTLNAGPFRETLAADPHVSAGLSTAQIEALLDPAQYTGLCRTFAERAAGAARETAAAIAARPR